MAILELLATTLAACGTDTRTPVPTDFNVVRVSYKPAVIHRGSTVEIAVTGLGEERLSMYLARTEDIYPLQDAFERGALVVLGTAQPDRQGTFMQHYTIPDTLPSSANGQPVPIDAGSWTLVLGTRTAHSSSLRTFGQLIVEAP